MENNQVMAAVILSTKCSRGEILISKDLEYLYTKKEKIIVTRLPNDSVYMDLKIIGVSEHDTICYMNYFDMIQLGTELNVDVITVLIP